MTFGNRLRQAREAAGLTQSELGRSLGTDGADASKSVVLGWEKDRHYPRADQLIVICRRLSVSADFLLLDIRAGLTVEAEMLARQFDEMSPEDRRSILILWDGVVKLTLKRRAEADSNTVKNHRIG